MRRLSWLLPWWNAYQATHSLHVIVAYRDAKVCGIMPLAETACSLTGRSLVFMGSGKVCSDDCGILVGASDAQEVSEAFATWMIQSPECCRWDHLNLDGVRENNFAMECFASQLQKLSGQQIERKPGPNCWSAPLAGGLEAFKNRLSKRAKKIFRDAESVLDSGKGTFEIAQSKEQAMAFARQIEDMHQSRWQERGIQGCFSTHEFTSFMDGAVAHMWQDAWGDGMKFEDVQSNETPAGKQRVLVGLLRINGIVAAGAICFRDRSAVAMYLVGMNPECAQDRPGWILNTAFIKYAIEQGCSEFDFLRGDEEYKGRLGGVPAVQHRWIVPSKRWPSQVRNLAYQTAVGLKAWWNDKSAGTALVGNSASNASS
ncbi:MAG: GNAT family N-acetyltransferase [Planctomycetota bacterium]|nr:GNAT family N-acetyltransferase [Planctomycetota bacterium]